MSVRNVVHENSYFDSVALMRVAASLDDRPGIEAVSLVMATDANQDVLSDAGLLTDEGRAAGPNDLIVAVRGNEAALVEALSDADAALSQPWFPIGGTASPSHAASPRRLVGAPEGANLALISTPGRYAAAEALKALRHGMHVFIFSDNVPVQQEVMLKQEAHRRGLLVMGADCGTTILNGVPLGFANAVRRGDVGLIGASGTGLQQISTLLDSMGVGISQLIGVGSHDLSAEVGGLSMLTALDALAEDPSTNVIVLVSKPPAPAVAGEVLARAAAAGKSVVVSFLGPDVRTPAPQVVVASDLRGAARAAARLSLGADVPAVEAPDLSPMVDTLPGRWLRALYAGGTFAYEAELLLRPVLGAISSRVGRYAPGRVPRLPDSHLVLDLGDDAFTSGRPHPMIDPATRIEFLRAAVRDPASAVVVVDIVIGHGAAEDPAGALAPVIAEAAGSPAAPLVLAFVVGTEHDPQNLGEQEQLLRDAGAVVVDDSTTAAEVAGDVLTKIGATR